jgi:hypothetical protein
MPSQFNLVEWFLDYIGVPVQTSQTSPARITSPQRVSQWQGTRQPEQASIQPDISSVIRSPQLPPTALEQSSSDGKPVPPKPPISYLKDIEWSSGVTSTVPDPGALIGIEDAFDHTPIQAGERVAFCRRDRVAYHFATWEFLKANNSGRCCICGDPHSFTFVTVTGKNQPPALKPVTNPGIQIPTTDQVISFQEAARHVNLAVTIQGYVEEVYETSIGTYFIRFEPRKPKDPVFQGFKVVIRPGYVKYWQQLGRSPLIYQNQTIRVRGIVNRHPTFGIEILVNAPNRIRIITEGKTPLEPPSEGEGNA